MLTPGKHISRGVLARVSGTKSGTMSLTVGDSTGSGAWAASRGAARCSAFIKLQRARCVWFVKPS